MKDRSDFPKKKEQNNKIAIILIPGFRSKHLFDEIWNNLPKIENIKSFELFQSKDSHNIVTLKFPNNKQSLHIYEIDWDEVTYNKNFDNQFYQLYLSFKVLFNLFINLLKTIRNLIYFSFKSERKRYWSTFCQVCKAPMLPFLFCGIPVLSIYLLLVNLVVFSSIISKLLTDTIDCKNISNVGSVGCNIIEAPKYFITQANFILEQLSRCFSKLIVCILPMCDAEALEKTKIVLSTILIIIWIIGIGFNSLFSRLLELYEFTNNYCQDELLRIKIRQKILKTVNFVFLDPSYKDIVIITHSFGTLLGTELLANTPISSEKEKNIKFISLGNILAVVGITYFSFINEIINKNNREYEWTDYYACFDLVATKIPKSKRRVAQEIVKYKCEKKLLSLITGLLSLITGKYHLVYFMQRAYVEKSKNKGDFARSFG